MTDIIDAIINDPKFQQDVRTAYIPPWAYPSAWNERQRRLRACERARKAYVRKCACWAKDVQCKTQ